MADLDGGVTALVEARLQAVAMAKLEARVLGLEKGSDDTDKDYRALNGLYMELNTRQQVELALRQGLERRLDKIMGWIAMLTGGVGVGVAVALIVYFIGIKK